MTLKLSMLLLSGLLISGCQSTTPNQQAAVETNVKSDAASDEIKEEPNADGSNVFTCRLEKVVGSNFRQKVCVSKKDAAEMQESARDQIRKFEENSGRVTGN